MKEKRSLSIIIKRNLWMLSFIPKYSFSLILHNLFYIPVVVANTYLSINYTRWILEKISAGVALQVILSFVIFISLFYILTNFVFALANIVWIPQKNINLTSRIREELVKKISRINQINFQKSEFFNDYMLGLNEIDSRATQVLDTVTTVLTSVLSIIVITGVTSGISDGFAIFGLIAAMTDVFLGVVRQKLNYQQTLDTTPDGRKRGYVNRLTYQSEFTADIKIYTNFKELLIANYREATKRVKGIILNYSKKIFAIDQVQQIVGVVCKDMLPWIYIAFLLVKERITVAEATVLAASALSIPQNLVTLLNSISSFYAHSLYIENIYKIFHYEEHIERDEGELINPAMAMDISVRDISFSYTEGGQDVIHNISLEIKEGAKIAIVGYNGAGKSTFVKLLIRLFDAQKGHIMINGKEIRDINVRSLRSHIAFLNQEYRIYSLTVAENVLMRPITCQEDIELVYDALKKVGLYEKILSWKDGVHTYITREFDESGQYLSGGEAQKLALARIYAGNYSCIIMDESTSALDPISEDEIISTIFEIFKDKTILMISHRLATIKYVERIYFFAEGKLVEQGTHSELMLSDKEYSKFYGAQADKYVW